VARRRRGEQNLRALDRVASEEEYSRSAFTAGVPAVAVIAPNPRLSQEEADEAKADWLLKFGGPTREPAILPAGTVVTPLAWSPEDAQMVAARQLSLQDVANMFGLDGYWLGAPSASLTYKSPGPLYLQLLRTSIEPMLQDFEQVWSDTLLPRGQSLRFDRWQILRDDFAVTVTTLVAATGAGIMTTEEARQYLGLGLLAAGVPPVSSTSPVATTPVDEATPEDVPQPGTAPGEVTP
jgi:HK97 family phage portal protein